MKEESHMAMLPPPGRALAESTNDAQASSRRPRAAAKPPGFYDFDDVGDDDPTVIIPKQTPRGRTNAKGKPARTASGDASVYNVVADTAPGVVGASFAVPGTAKKKSALQAKGLKTPGNPKAFLKPRGTTGKKSCIKPRGTTAKKAPRPQVALPPRGEVTSTAKKRSARGVNAMAERVKAMAEDSRIRKTKALEEEKRLSQEQESEAPQRTVSTEDQQAKDLARKMEEAMAHKQKEKASSSAPPTVHGRH